MCIQTKIRALLSVLAVCSSRGMSPLFGPGRLEFLYAPISPFKTTHRKTGHAKKDVAFTLLENAYVFLATYHYFFLYSPTCCIQCTSVYYASLLIAQNITTECLSWVLVLVDL